MIRLSKITVLHTAAANTAVGNLALLDATGVAQPANWELTMGAAGYFLVNGGVLTTISASIPAGFYAVKVRANAQHVRLKEKALFVIQVM